MTSVVYFRLSVHLVTLDLSTGTQWPAGMQGVIAVYSTTSYILTVYVWDGVSPSEEYVVEEVSLGELSSRPVFSEARFSVSVSESMAAIVDTYLLYNGR